LLRTPLRRRGRADPQPGHAGRGADRPALQIWHNTITGMGSGDRYNPLFEVDKQPNGGTNVVDCNDYGNLSTAGNTVNGNFALPSNDWLTLADWQAHNGHGWDADSAVGGFSPDCPSESIP
jgi:hypothetical protein